MVQWTAEKDQLLLKGVFQFNNITFSKPLLEHLASMVGEDCTPKAVSHRLNNIKNSGKPTKAPGSASSSPVKGAGVKKTQAGRGKKAKATDSGASDEGQDNDTPTPAAAPAPRKRGRPKKSAVNVATDDQGDEEQMQPKQKKVKSEQTEDVMPESENEDV
ncbi:unnamed protein product [Periconia digitata]|uniref:Uncharacterized protein n=1 Tax=Periconia digitata TaxID=1303443 RepID=A0A9W4UEY6_9PLEO|nr:unnamed protein product [Periconia digitata]